MKTKIETKIEGTLFGVLLSCRKLKSDNALLGALVTWWDKSLEGFRILGKFLPFRVEDVLKDVRRGRGMRWVSSLN